MLTLTENEKKWIEQREAMQFLTGTYIADFEEYPLWNSGKDWQEAAEFEARVAALIAKLYADKFADVVLKHARLQVEKEMDKC